MGVHVDEAGADEKPPGIDLFNPLVLPCRRDAQSDPSEAMRPARDNR